MILNLRREVVPELSGRLFTNLNPTSKVREDEYAVTFATSSKA
jgi:hypothetical protein